MSSQHHATPEQWQAIEANGHLPTRSTILELRDRIKSLEAAAQQPQPNHPAEPDSSLVELVAASIDFGCRHNRDPDLTARAAIRLVATWLQSWHGRSTASTAALEREVER